MSTFKMPVAITSSPYGRRAFLCIFSLIIIGQLAGCGASNKDLLRQKGYELSSTNKYCEAYNHYQVMLASPDNANDAELKSSAENAGRECVRQIIRAYQKQIAANRFDTAISELTKAKQIDPKNKTVVKLLADAKSRLADYRQTLADHESKASGLKGRKEWHKALDELKQGLALDPAHAGMLSMRKEIEGELDRANELLNDANQSLKNLQWRKAITSFEAALQILPANKSAIGGIQTARQSLAKSDELVAAGNSQLTSGQYSSAAKNFQEVLKIDPSSPDAAEGLVAVYKKISSDFEAKGLTGTAIHFLGRALKMQPDNSVVKEKLLSLETELSQRIECSLALVPVKEYQRDPDFSEKLSKEMLTQLMGKDRGIIKVTDHRKLEKELSDTDLTVESLVDSKKLEKLKGIKAAQAVIAGKVASFKVKSEKNREKKSKQYQSGTNRKRNPEYDEAQAELRNAEMRAEALKRTADQASGGFGLFAKIVSSAAGGADVGSARAKLAQTPDYIEEPVYSDWTYYVVHHTKTADAQITVRLIDTENASTLLEENIQSNVSRNYETIDNPNPSIDIVDKPIPDNIEDALKSDAIKQLATKFDERLSSIMSRYAIRYWQKAESLSQRNLVFEAAEQYMNFLYAVRQTNEFDSEKNRIAEFMQNIELSDSKSK